MPANERLKAFRTRHVGRLRQKIFENIDLYRSGSVHECPGEEILDTALGPGTEFPSLSGKKAADDVGDAIFVFNYLSDLKPSQAVDERLWTHLTHVTFADYCSRRWPVDTGRPREKLEDHVRSHWFVQGGRGGLRRNAIARLWWAAHLTVAPMENDDRLSEFLRGRWEEEDRFRYTRVLLSNQDIYQGLIERRFGSSDRVRMITLEVLRGDRGGSKSIGGVAKAVFKQLNLVSSYRELPCMPCEQIFELVDRMARDTHPDRSVARIVASEGGSDGNPGTTAAGGRRKGAGRKRRRRGKRRRR